MVEEFGDAAVTECFLSNFDRILQLLNLCYANRPFWGSSPRLDVLEVIAHEVRNPRQCAIHRAGRQLGAGMARTRGPGTPLAGGIACPGSFAPWPQFLVQSDSKTPHQASDLL